MTSPPKQTMGRLPGSVSSQGKIHLGLILLSTYLVYRAAVQFPYINYDDNYYVFNNPRVLNGLTLSGAAWALAEFSNGMWCPLSWLSLMLESSLLGPNPGHFHLTNIWIHLANVTLVFVLVKDLTRHHLPGLLASAVFALHPSAVESVAWISERKGLLTAFFFLLSVIAYIRHRTHASSPYYILAITSALLAALCKPIVVALPLILLFHECYVPSPDSSRATTTMAAKVTRVTQTLIRLLPLGIVALLAATVAMHTQVIDSSRDLSYRVTNMLVAISEYLVQTLFPQIGSVVYVRPEYWEPTRAIGAVLIVSAAGAVLIHTFRHEKLSAFGICWFLAAALPISGIVPIGEHYKADRYLYLPVVGLLIAIAAPLRRLTRPQLHRAYLILWITFATFCLTITKWELKAWASSTTLFCHALSSNAGNYRALLNLSVSSLEGLKRPLATNGVPLIPDDRNARALRYAKRALAETPIEDAYLLAGFALEKNGDTRSACQYYHQGIKDFPHNPYLKLALARSSLRQKLARGLSIQSLITHTEHSLRSLPGDKRNQAIAHLVLNCYYSISGQPLHASQSLASAYAIAHLIADAKLNQACESLTLLQRSDAKPHHSLMQERAYDILFAAL